MTGDLSYPNIAQTYNVSMSSNDNNVHTPIDGSTGTYLTVSSSNIPMSQSFNLYYYATGSSARYRIKMSPNSSSVADSDGYLAGQHFSLSGSINRGGPTPATHFYYSSPDINTFATSSAIEITSFASSSTSFGADTYTFYLSGSGPILYEFPATASENSSDYIPYDNIYPFEYYSTAVVAGTSASAVSVWQMDHNSGSITDGITSLRNKINEYASTLGVTATSSATTIQFTAVTDTDDTLYSFATQSLTQSLGEFRHIFYFSQGGTTATTAPTVPVGDHIYKIPLALSTSEHSVMTASAAIINSINNFSASVSGSDANAYGLVISNFAKRLDKNISGSTPQFTYEIITSGSTSNLLSAPEITNGVVRNIPIEVPYGASAEQMVAASVYYINRHMSFNDKIFGDTALWAEKAEWDNYELGIPPGNFWIYGATVGDVTASLGIDTSNDLSTNIIGSVIISGSGNYIGHNPGTRSPMTSSDAAIGFFGFDEYDNSSMVLSGSSTAQLYLSGSGRMGIATNDPISDLDIRADEFQIQSKAKRRGVRMNDEGNMESFANDSAAAATGSEFILSYSNGVSITAAMMHKITGQIFPDDPSALVGFNSKSTDEQSKILYIAELEGFLEQGNVGDVLGSIRWITESGSAAKESAVDKRRSGEAASIQAICNSSDSTGITADIIFNLAVAKESAPVQALRLDANGQHMLTGSLNISQNLNIDGSQVDFTNLPTSNPSVAGRLWNDGGSLMISAG